MSTAVYPQEGLLLPLTPHLDELKRPGPLCGRLGASWRERKEEHKGSKGHYWGDHAQ